MSSAWNVISNHIILDTVFAFCSPGTMVRVSWTCRTVYALVKSYLRVAYDINRHLSYFFPDPVAFRSLQARTATLIAGSNALQFFERTVYPDSDLDLYVPKPCVAEVGTFLLAIGYTFRAAANQEKDFPAEAPCERIGRTPYPGPIYNILKFEKQVGGENRCVEVISCLCPISCIIGAHSTCLMNFISFEQAYCLFAQATLEERCAIVCTTEPQRVRLAVQKYGPKGHGWTMLRGIPRRAALSGIVRVSLRAGSRTVNDARSWALPLNMDGVSTPRPSAAQDTYRVHDPAVLSRWRFDSQGGPPVRIGPELCWHARIHLFRSALLKYTYVIEDKTDMFEYASRFLNLLQRTKGARLGHLCVIHS
ncbi:hypothetical protein DENSPDRAFT_902680 [Dentipellis sp. KUC8613]|nr:hypothetical protein DENSPDRAFT_902680 [Dentipellis sp. KUC8613]